MLLGNNPGDGTRMMGIELGENVLAVRVKHTFANTLQRVREISSANPQQIERKAGIDAIIYQIYRILFLGSGMNTAEASASDSLESIQLSGLRRLTSVTSVTPKNSSVIGRDTQSLREKKQESPRVSFSGKVEATGYAYRQSGARGLAGSASISGGGRGLSVSYKFECKATHKCKICRTTKTFKPFHRSKDEPWYS